MAKKKRQSLSTGSIVAIVVGIVIVVFMLLTFVDSQNNYEKETQDNYQIQFDAPESQSNTPTCGYDEVLGAEDLKCHPKCGDSGYCDDRDVCYQEECYAYPHSAIECFDIVEGKHDVFFSTLTKIDKLPEETFDEDLYKYNMVTKVFKELQDSSEYCLNEIDNADFILEELGYDMGAYSDWWNDMIITIDTGLKNQKEVLENYYN